MTKFDIITEGLRFPEGPVALADGSWLVVEIAGQALTHIASDGTKTVIAQLEGGPNGAAMGPDGWVYICNSGGWIYAENDDGMYPIGQSERSGWIERVNLKTGQVEHLYAGTSEKTLNSPNDLVFDDHGGFWFTDLGKRRADTRDVGAVYYAKADGSHIECAIPLLYEPNGIGLSPDGDRLYVAETPTRRVLAFDIIAPGKAKFAPWPAPSGGQLVRALPGLNNLDSLAVDSAGHICVAALGEGGIWDISPDGATADKTLLPDRFSTNICFGGSDGTTAFATLSMSGLLVSFPWRRPGLKPRHQGDLW
ncbi:SMP-30/gluconolactonase/LRE family protein [Alterisphingorhabdus coralli]|uniref:SMP-30/gluconolactonase/LRE family protein n=1 Tax=Alterisphingorhabdus coralli TaxID=3071408 RepID=A0AA97F6Y0_9SPHN|nr:SMP-30/gluconolactonase/LRE family protein [Parasphingorhabdus sp. SCSIO 66989]WOE75504.1 SMP-30/gluconolactonase/LRE family protein [Parasphingorhabdus sp. SCSIO 66989]